MYSQFSNESKLGWINITFSSFFFFHNQIQIECSESVKKHISLKKIIKKIQGKSIKAMLYTDTVRVGWKVSNHGNVP